MSEGLSTAELTISQLREVLASTEEGKIFSLLDEMKDDPRKGVQLLITQYRNKIAKLKAEEKRLKNMWKKEKNLYDSGYNYIGGLDEAGRGPLAGPVVAACVILPPYCELPGLDDSKKLSPEKRETLARIIKNKARAWAVGVVDQREIDKINILQATKKSMVEAIKGLQIKPDYLLIDALDIPVDFAQEGIIHGDSISASIAAASIIAKTYRDAIMDEIDVLYPQYGFKEHKGYGTVRHREALIRFGPSPVHRRSFLHKLNQNT